MIYLVIKSVHVASVIVWMGLMIFVPGLLAALSLVAEESRLSVAVRVRTHYVVVGSIAMLGTWIFGLALMVMGGWMSSSWMIAKIILVLALSALHGFISGQFRRLATDSSFKLGGWPPVVTCCQILAVLLIVTLVVQKPF